MDTRTQFLEKWQIQVLPRATKKALNYLAAQNWLKKDIWYLAGGTALALQTGHRTSVDLDFFTRQKDFSPAKLLKHFSDRIWISDIVREGTVYGRLYGAKISFIAYPFFRPKQPYERHGSVPVLNMHDIAVMKIVAISQRGRKRDFIDLYWYCKNQRPLVQALRCLPEQYPTVAHNYNHIIKSLTYFDDAEQDPMPKIFFKTTWGEVKKFFQQESVKIARKWLLP